jgi:hypothetical protein
MNISGSPRPSHDEGTLASWVAISTSVDPATTMTRLTSSLSPFHLRPVSSPQSGSNPPIAPVAGDVNAVKGGSTVPLKLNTYAGRHDLPVQRRRALARLGSGCPWRGGRRRRAELRPHRHRSSALARSGRAEARRARSMTSVDSSSGFEVSPGQHEIVLSVEGYETVRQKAI